MSVEIHVCWQGDLVADKAELKAALGSLGFEATVLYDFSEAEAFWPIDLAGLKTGVEIYLDEDLATIREDYPVLTAALEGRDRMATFRFGGNAAEAGTALALAAALTKLSNAIIYDPQGETFMSADEAVKEAQTFFEEAVKVGAQQREE
ncbi:MAG: hypothetical protein Q8L22_28765 [Reyranella sp.]|nr:hypothetical protein [Reyranella sp.]